MKGLIFVELLSFMEMQLGVEMQEAVIEDAALPNDAAFTAVGQYPSDYVLKLVVAAAERTGQSPNELVRAFGHHLFGRFEQLFPQIVQRYSTAREMLDHVKNHIHEEVRAIYPDARPPSVETRQAGDGYQLVYQSHRPMAHLAFGLIEACIASYGDRSVVEWTSDAGADSATFLIRPMRPEEIS